MLPAQRKKVDLSTMTEEEKKLFRLYGKLPTHKNVLTKVQKDRKYFDSGDYALSKAGVTPQSNVGTAIPNPESIPHASPPSNLSTSNSGTPVTTPGAAGLGTSPIRESPLSGAGHSSLEHPHLDTNTAQVIEPASTSPTSSYPIAGHEAHSSPLNPATSGEGESTVLESAADAPNDNAEGSAPVAIPGSSHLKTVNLTTIVPGINKSDLPNAPTPASGELADTEMAP